MHCRDDCAQVKCQGLFQDWDVRVQRGDRSWYSVAQWAKARWSFGWTCAFSATCSFRPDLVYLDVRDAIRMLDATSGIVLRGNVESILQYITYIQHGIFNYEFIPNLCQSDGPN